MTRFQAVGAYDAIVRGDASVLGSENPVMTLSFKWFAGLAASLLVTAIAASAQALPNPTPLPQQPPAPGASAVGPSKMAPTGLAENGGSIANDVYTNSMYGFSMKVPPGWVVVPSKNPTAPPASSRESPLVKAMQTNHVLLVMTENAPMKKSVERKSVQIVATHLINKPLPNEGETYLNYSKRTAAERKMAVEYKGDPKEVTINGTKFWTVGLNQSIEGGVQHIVQYVTTQGSVLLQFMLVSPDEKGVKDLEPSIQSVKMKPIAEKPAPSKPSRRKSPTGKTTTAPSPSSK